MKNSNLHNKFPSLNREPFVFYLITTFTFLLILIRLIFLQLLNHETYKRMSDENRIRLIATQPIRGRILDKNGFILADSRFKYSLIVKPQYVDQRLWQKYKLKIAQLFNISSDSLQKKYFDGLKNKSFSITLLDDLNVEQVIKFRENENILDGLEILTKIIRNYPYKTVASHVEARFCLN